MKFLVLRFSSIGDIVLTTPVVRHLKQVEGAEVHFVTKVGFKAVIQNNPDIDKCFYLEDDFDTLIDTLKNENYDVIIDLHRNLRTKKIKLALRKPSRSFDKLNMEKWLHVNFKISRFPNTHIVDRYLKTIEGYYSNNDLQGLDYFTSPSDDGITEKLPLEARQKGYVALVIGAMHFTKQIPHNKVIEMAKAMALPVVLMGGPNEKGKAQAIIDEVQDPKVISMVGKCSLNESAVLIRESKAVITSDTGLMHIAAAYHKHVFSVWGSTIPEYGMYPYLPNEDEKQHIYEVKNLKCRSCSKIGHQACPKKHFHCMEKIDFQKLIDEVNAVCEE